MVHLSPSVATPKMAKAKTPKKNGAVDTPAKPEVKTPKQGKKTPAKAALQTPKVKKETLVKDEKSTPKISALQTPKTHKISNDLKNTPKAATKTPKQVTASANKNNKVKTPKHEKPVEDFEMESEEEEEALAPQHSLKKNVNNSEDAVMSSEEDSEEEKIEVESKSDKSPGNKRKSNKAAGKRKLEDSNQSGGDQKRQKITYDNEIFIACLSFSTSKDTLKEHFSQFGEVVNVGMPLKPLKKQSNKGFAFVAFKEASAMKKALADTNQEIDSAKIVIEPRKTQNTVSMESNPKPSHPNELFVGGLHKSTEQHVLEEYFSKYGRVGNVTLPWNQKDKRNKGYGFVSFESAASLQSALEDNHEIDGKKVAVHTSGKKSEENLVVPKKAGTKKAKAETTKAKAALATATVAEEDEDDEMEDEDEEGNSDDEAEGEEDEIEEGDSDDEAEKDEVEEGDSDDEAEGEEDEVEEGDSDDEAEEDEVEEGDSDDVAEGEEDEAESDSDDQYEGEGNDDEEGDDDDDE